MPVDADEGQLRQILWNLATNGLRAMPQGGEIRLVAREERGSDGHRLAVLEVSDQGVGIAADEIDMIFQPFRGSFGKGTGLGLAIVYRIVTDNGGRIDVQSAPGRGTWVQVVAGQVEVNGQVLLKGDGAAVDNVETVTVTASEDAEFLLFDVA